MQHIEPDICNSRCPSRHLFELLAEKWTMMVIFRLRKRQMRTAELRREIEGVSEKMLIQTLRKLERHGIVSRHDFGEVPPRVEYRLTELGASLSTPVELLERWVAQNYAAVTDARERFEAKQTKTPRRAA